MQSHQTASPVAFINQWTQKLRNGLQAFKTLSVTFMVILALLDTSVEWTDWSELWKCFLVFLCASLHNQEHGNQKYQTKTWLISSHSSSMASIQRFFSLKTRIISFSWETLTTFWLDCLEYLLVQYFLCWWLSTNGVKDIVAKSIWIPNHQIWMRLFY